ncbi:RHO1 GDP-GTP exchange protein 2 [Mortierella claussenii]|nr:RHO1 GDP-GTP exchange protein 2 [Mortierella claussenii]
MASYQSLPGPRGNINGHIPFQPSYPSSSNSTLSDMDHTTLNGSYSNNIGKDKEHTSPPSSMRTAMAGQHCPTSSRQQQQQEQRVHKHGEEAPITRNTTFRDPAVQKKLAMQMEYQRSLAQISRNDEDDSAYSCDANNELEHGSSPSQQQQRQQLHGDYYSSSAQAIAARRGSVTAHTQDHVSLTSPSASSSISAHEHRNVGLPPTLFPHSSQQHMHLQQPIFTQPRHHDHTDIHVNSSYSSAPANYVHSNYQQQHAGQQQQHPYHQQQQYYQNNNTNMFSPTTPSSSYTSIHPYTPSAPSSKTSSTWMQSSPTGGSTGSLSTHDSIHGSFSSSQYNAMTTPPYLSLEAQLLLDFTPGILSTIAVAFRQKMLDNESKRSESESYGLEFPVTFTGKEAVDVLVELTRLNDRRHALAVARSLETQFLFFGGGGDRLFDSNNDQYFFSDAALAYVPGKAEFPTVPTGVFPYSTKCYSYGCLPGDATCYSYLCPNRRHIGNALGRQNSGASSVGSQEKVWANSVPASVVAAASKKERNRQEAIFEIVNTEQNYVRDLELMEEIFITPLRAGDIIAADKVESFIEDVFLNYKEIMDLNRRLLEDLRARQEEQPLVERIGDILLAHVVGFEEAYTRYIPRIALSEFTYKREERQNPKFAQFLQECTRHPEARRLGLRHFVGQPYQRIPRYPLLLTEVIKRTEENVDDREIVQEVVKVCTELGKRVDACMPQSARQLRLLTLQDKIIWKSKEEHQDLKLSEKSRKLHFECIFRRKATFEVQATDYRVFVFDHMLLMTKEKRDKQGDKSNILYQVYKNPIPLELVNVWPDDGKPVSLSARDHLGSRPKSAVLALSPKPEPNVLMNEAGLRSGYAEAKYTAPATVQHRGRKGGEYLLFMAQKDRDEFVEHVDEAKETRQDVVSGSHLFEFQTIAEMNAQPPALTTALDLCHPMDGKRVTCSATYINVLDGKRRIVIGTEDGVYVGFEDDKASFWLAMKDIHANDIAILEDYHLLLILSGKVLKAYNMTCLEPHSDKIFQTGRQLAKNVQYFTAGVCVGKTLVITMKKKSTGDSLFSSFEPIENAVLGGGVGSHGNKGFGLSLGKSKSEWFKTYREFYVPSESSRLQMLSRMVCIVCPKGFEVLMLENLDETRVYPSKHDPEYAFLLKRPESLPVSMFKISSDFFLMCYTDFAFTMTKNGNLAKTELIEFEGRAESFAMVYPYIIAFESQLIEIRHIETGALEQLILGDNIRLLHSGEDLKGNPMIHILMNDPTKGDIRQVVRLNKVAPKPRTLLTPMQYRPRSSYVPQTAPSSSSMVEPVLYQPKSTYIPQSNSTPRLTPTPHLSAAYPSVSSPQVPPQFAALPIPQKPSPRLAQQQPPFAAYPPEPSIPLSNSVVNMRSFHKGVEGVLFPTMPTPIQTMMPMPMPMPIPMPTATTDALPMAYPAATSNSPAFGFAMPATLQPGQERRQTQVSSTSSGNLYSPTSHYGYSQPYPVVSSPDYLYGAVPVSSPSTMAFP